MIAVVAVMVFKLVHSPEVGHSRFGHRFLRSGG